MPARYNGTYVSFPALYCGDRPYAARAIALAAVALGESPRVS